MTIVVCYIAARWLPWLAYAMIGVDVGRLFLRTRDDPQTLRMLMGLMLMVGFVTACIFGPSAIHDMVALSSAGVLVEHRVQIPFWYPPADFVAFHCGVVLVEFVIMAKLMQLAIFARTIGRPLVVTGKAALMIFVAHHVVGYRVLVTAGLMNQEYGTMTPAIATIAGVVMLAGCWAGAVIWTRYRARTKADMSKTPTRIDH